MSPKVLIVEDNANLRLAMSTYLRMKGFEVLEAGTLAGAKGAIVSPGLAATITDLNLPDGKGDQLLPLASHPVIAMTGQVDDATKSRLNAQGFAAFLPKPATLDQVLATLKDLLPINS